VWAGADQSRRFGLGKPTSVRESGRPQIFETSVWRPSRPSNVREMTDSDDKQRSRATTMNPRICGSPDASVGVMIRSE
jgi:hypothetical protein